jgi:iron-sulfur cluster repair protein YtfE (RIC family)
VAARPSMEPGAIRQSILAEHARLRELLDEISALAERFHGGDETVGEALREAAMGLYETFAAHLRREEATLEPALREQGADGVRLADRLSHEHREQRALLTYLAGRLSESSRPTILVARELRNFIEYVRLDMVHEETSLLTAAVLPDERREPSR